MTSKIILAGALAAIAATGCTSSYQHRPLVEAQAPLATGRTVVIATPADSVFAGKPYAGSGAATAAAFRDAFARHSSDVVVSAPCRDLGCLRQAHPTGTYFVVPTIVHWVDRATEWSGKSDMVQLRVTVHDAAGPAPLAGTEIFGKSKWATFGGDHPEELLPEPVGTYVDALY